MKIDKNKRQVIAAAQKVTTLIQERLGQKSTGNEAKIDLAKIAQKMADRREKVLKGEDDEK